MWIVRITAECEVRFRKDFSRGLFSSDDGVVMKTWAREMERFGPKYIEGSKRWDDHPLWGIWEGFRASSYSKSGRIIYKVFRITPDHDYTR